MSRDPQSPHLRHASRQRFGAPGRNRGAAVVETAIDRVVGGCGLLSRRQDEFELGYCLRKSSWGRGIATEAVRAVLDAGFRHLHAHRVYATVDPDNPSSAHVLEKLGFRREGRARRDARIGEEWRDSLLYALLAEEWNPNRPGAAKSPRSAATAPRVR